MEDIKIGRNLQTDIRIVSSPADTMILPSNPRRVVAVVSVFGLGPGVSIVIYPTPWPLSVGEGIVIVAENPTVTLRIEDYGSTLRQQWNAFDPVGSVVVTILDSQLAAQSSADLKTY